MGWLGQLIARNRQKGRVTPPGFLLLIRLHPVQSSSRQIQCYGLRGTESFA